MRILNFFIDIMFYILDILGVGLLYVGGLIEIVFEKLFVGVEIVCNLLFDTIPNKVSLFYRIQRIFYPIRCDFDLEQINTEVKDWLNDNVGKHHWKIIKRGFDFDTQHRHLYFRQETDAAAFKLRWT